MMGLKFGEEAVEREESTYACSKIMYPDLIFHGYGLSMPVNS